VPHTDSRWSGFPVGLSVELMRAVDQTELRAHRSQRAGRSAPAPAPSQRPADSTLPRVAALRRHHILNRTGRATRRCTQLASNVLSLSWLSSPSIGVMLLVAFQAEELHLLFLPRCNYVRWASLALHSPSESVRMVHDEPQAGSSAPLTLLAFGCLQCLTWSRPGVAVKVRWRSLPR
jgi:hypothetical protein